MGIYEQENDKLFNDFLENFFFEPFRNGSKLKQLELIISPKCNLACKYCYIHKYANETFPDNIFDEEKSLKNMTKILKWLYKNKYIPELDIFSGELFAQEIGYKLMELIYDFYKEVEPEYRIPSIIIPTNFTFLCSEKYTEKIRQIKRKLKEINIRLHLSSSFDGKFEESNRPFKTELDIDLNVIRDDEYYERVFKFIKEENCGIHPMLYSDNIESWQKNFLWFQDMLKKHDIPWNRIFLLQVRNVEWTDSQNKELYEFLNFLIDFAWEKCNYDKERFINFLYNDSPRGFNILHAPFSERKRGLSCAIQSELALRISDLKCVPCHRTMYESFVIGQMIDDDENILKFETKNAELGLSIYGSDFKSYPICSTCPISDLCIGQCLGSQYEVTGDLFMPIPTVCKNHHLILKAIIDGFYRIGVYQEVAKKVTNIKRIQMEFIRKGEI